jgi:hypothetical protein
LAAAETQMIFAPRNRSAMLSFKLEAPTEADWRWRNGPPITRFWGKISRLDRAA